MDRFLEKFSNLLVDLKATNKSYFVFTDSNINLLNLNSVESSGYLNSILANVYFCSVYLKLQESRMIVIL